MEVAIEIILVLGALVLFMVIVLVLNMHMRQERKQLKTFLDAEVSFYFYPSKKFRHSVGAK